MTISSSLNAGVAGLNANATRLATIADNIANSGTFGYKRAAADFDSMVITGSSGSGTYSAGGVRANTMRLIDERGAVIATSNPMDIAIAGRGMLPVISSSALNSMSGDRPLMMTTTGSFRTDADGVLMTQSGLVLMGWPADADGTIASMPRDTMVGLEPVVINANQTAGDPTTEINMGINLPAVDTEFGASGAARTTSIEYFGNLGTSETLDVTFTPDLPALATDPGTNTWTMVITDSASGGAVIGEYTLVFNDSRTNGGTLNSVTAIGASPVYDAAAGSVTLVVEGGPIEVTVGKVGDTNGLTQLSSSFAPTSITKDGSPVGNLTAVEIDESGFIQATYDTGFTRVIYQIPLVDVPNPNGLIAMNDQTFEVSPVSGSFFLWDAGDGPTGSIVGYAREGSTTDVAAELTNLIQTQRAYSSNAKIIQTVDEMLQETTNIKR
ncbi:flagellar hook-basal body complex protein [Cereibacter changlensis]|jgi:flagellar hook protein FlgE|uniref:Flagellar hook protein FlgE n=1 Tax=Cereibacter changlensis TaxID=402884 RepID=A0A4U0YXY9_9RHOB|nr:flagellar hook-basal body complex protein [Cereibacter changlensis]MBZ4689630.1 flagellar biosynthesis protein FlgE [Cereibacter sp.]TKA96658.1 flagellar hook-basal body complex protein [Cereibacter changlensis]